MTSLSTTSSRDGDSIVLTCCGSAESASIAALQAALETTQDSATNPTVRSVVADLRDLEFAASSCLKVFVSWLWQRRSLGALAAFAGDVVEIQTETA